MQTLLLCSCDPLFLKSLYGVLRQEGYEIDIAKHPVDAVKMSFVSNYSAVIMDTGNIGFSAYEAAAVIRSIAEGVPVIIAGDARLPSGSISIGKPLDLEEVKEVLRNLCSLPYFNERRIRDS